MVQGLSIENWLKCDVFYFSSKWVGELRLFSKKPNTYCPKWKRSGNVPSHLKHEEKSFPNRKLSLIVHVVNVGFCVSWVLRIEHYSMHHIRLMCCKEDKVTKWRQSDKCILQQILHTALKTCEWPPGRLKSWNTHFSPVTVYCQGVIGWYLGLFHWQWQPLVTGQGIKIFLYIFFPDGCPAVSRP